MRKTVKALEPKAVFPHLVKWEHFQVNHKLVKSITLQGVDHLISRFSARLHRERGAGGGVGEGWGCGDRAWVSRVSDVALSTVVALTSIFSPFATQIAAFVKIILLSQDWTRSPFICLVFVLYYYLFKIEDCHPIICLVFVSWVHREACSRIHHKQAWLL